MRILYITTIAGSMVFFPDVFKELLLKGHTVELACNCEIPVKNYIETEGLIIHNIPFSRSPFSQDNLKAYKRLKKLVTENKYDIVHCHTPNAAAITRLACKGIRKKGTKIIYTAHGFHFYKGAPKKNWLIYYPVEWLCAHWTDVLITINSEDYILAKRKMHAGKVEYVPGVGVRIERFRDVTINRTKKREEIGVPNDAFVLITVGELNDNKNQITILRALSKLNNPNIYYVMAGKGNMDSVLASSAKELGIENQVKLLGYRTDVNELYHASDAFCFPSKREGLGLGAVEAMLAGLPIITSNVHGINDYSQDGVTGFKCSPLDIDGFAEAILKIVKDADLRKKMGTYNKAYAEKYDVNRIIQLIGDIYGI